MHMRKPSTKIAASKLPTSATEERQLPQARVEATDKPSTKTASREVPTKAVDEREVPEAAVEEQELPAEDITAQELPPTRLHPENWVTLDGVEMEIKPTRMYYQYNKCAGFYTTIGRVLDAGQFMMLFNLPDDYFGDASDNRSPLKRLMDWITAVVDDEKFTKKHFDNLTIEDISKLYEIFMRVNDMDKSDDSKNQQAAADQEKT